MAANALAGALLLLLLLLGPSCCNRSSRAVYLVFPQGSNVQLVYCLTLATHTKPQGFFTFGVTAGLAYELPYRGSVPHRKPAEVYHRRSRRDLYRKIELMLQARGKNGRDCVLGALCRAGARNRNGTTTRAPFLQELLHSLFTFPPHEAAAGEEYDRAYGAELDCADLYRRCPDVF